MTPHDGTLMLEVGSESPAGQAPDASEDVSRLLDENESLGRELLRCYEQMSLLFEITENIAHLGDAATIQAALIRRYGSMLNVGALLLEDGTRCQVIDGYESLGRPLPANGGVIRAALHGEIQRVRESQRALTCRLDAPGSSVELRGAHAMLGSLQQCNAPQIVLIALRHHSDAPFDTGERLAAESVLGYGGHILTNALMLRQVQQMAMETVRALANAIDAKDNYTRGHSERVGWLAKFLGRALGLPPAELQHVEWAGLLHDVGKIGVPEWILNKPGPLTSEETAEMQKHPRLSYEVLKPIASLESILPGVLYHHENHDGSGYPERIRGEDIPLIARILHVVDIFDALTSTRAYRTQYSIDRAMEILREGAGRVTDPRITDVFIRSFRQYMRDSQADYLERFAHIALGPAPAASD
ncbi:MAG: HD-GYP domain-containing protein [Phycisphaerales bacterium]|nr:HD-GYP domain-containing protein [Phycisphaerales bacterium]